MTEIIPDETTPEEVLALQETPAAEDDDEVKAHWSSVSIAVCHPQ